MRAVSPSHTLTASFMSLTFLSTIIGSQRECHLCSCAFEQEKKKKKSNAKERKSKQSLFFSGGDEGSGRISEVWGKWETRAEA